MPTSDPSDERLHEEGLRPRWSDWEVEQAPPSQSYQGYVDASTRSLPPAVLSAFRRCSPYPNSGHDDPFPAITSPSFTPPYLLYRRFDSVYGLVQHKLVATRDIREKEVLGFVGGHLELLDDAAKEGVDNRGHPSHVLIERGYLEKYYEYSGQHAVVLSMKRYHSPLQRLRDPALLLSELEERRPELDAYNVNVDVALDPQSRMPVVIAYAWVPIEAGTELFAFLSLGRWYSRDHKRLFIASRVSHWYHRSVLQLEQLLHAHSVDTAHLDAQQPDRKEGNRRMEQQMRKQSKEAKEKERREKKRREHERARRRLGRERQARHGDGNEEASEQAEMRNEGEEKEERKEELVDMLDTDVEGEKERKEERQGGRAASASSRASQTAADASPPGPVLSALDEWRFLGDEGEREAAIAQWNRTQTATSSNRGMQKVELYKAFALSRCTYVKKLFVGKTVNDETRDVWRVLPDFIPESIDIDGIAHPVEPAVVRRLVDSGHEEQLVELREVTSLVSPVRYYTVPWSLSFCVVAKKLIKRGTPILMYSGELEQEIRNRDSVYVYDTPADSVRLQWPNYPPDMPDMVIDAEKYGGVARFVNDSRYRAEEALGGAEGCTQNVDTFFVFIEHCLHLCFYATRDIKAREELISHYGDAFWSVCTGQMILEHRKYYDTISHYHQQLVDLCYANSLPLPRPPSQLLEAEPLFERKPRRYACEAKASDTTLSVEEEWEVEAILGKSHHHTAPRAHTQRPLTSPPHTCLSPLPFPCCPVLLRCCDDGRVERRLRCTDGRHATAAQPSCAAFPLLTCTDVALCCVDVCGVMWCALRCGVVLCVFRA